MSDKKSIDPNSPYSYLLINRPLRRILFITVVVCTVVLTAFLFLEMRNDRNVGLMSLYTLTICSILIFYPPTETWVYKPWQKAPQRLERHDGK